MQSAVPWLTSADLLSLEAIFDVGSDSYVGLGTLLRRGGLVLLDPTLSSPKMPEGWQKRTA